MKLEQLQHELTVCEKQWREANEKELPEEEFRVNVEQKRKELNYLIAEFSSQLENHMAISHTNDGEATHH